MIYLGKYKVLNSRIVACDYDWVVKKIFGSLNKKIIVAPVASHPITMAYLEKDYQNILNKINLILPDSQYVLWALKFLYGIRLKERVYGPELFLRLCKEAEIRKKTIYLIGNNIKKLIVELKRKYPKILINGFYDLHYEVLSENLVFKIHQRLKKEKIEIIFIGIGSPNQHKLAIKLKINRPLICVGAAFDFISGNKRQAPKWMQSLGIESLFRFIQEPIRLFVRYFVYGPMFIFLVLTQKLKKN